MKTGLLIEQRARLTTAPWVPVSRSSLPIPDFGMSSPPKIRGSGGRPLRRRRPSKNIFWAVCDLERELSHKVLLAKPSTSL
ncbi:hypothetical protein O0I10_005398 [Lichtheimia ornata]|uniref:Uncharacterized protein n=1 Tax=Lichtheimia ornata TaxID=688661 RepID=A0AAD7XZR9_9FUNG|nr:uncharacterized protein O0I10_005398 [Lichtheimia ornata]KAJ8659016.1 hypothetical protein O0I10_005398 [Lichtheimia ornata]